jgi:hypothetical protein
MIVHKRGDTFEGAGVAALDAGFVERFDLTGCSVRVWMRHPDGDLVKFAVVVTDAEQGEFMVSESADKTALWRPGDWLGEVEYTCGAEVTSTESFRIHICEDIIYGD